MKNWISIAPLYSDKYLSHARTYSHKYIKREPDGKGGWIYTYPTMSSYNKPAHTTSYTNSDGTIVTQNHQAVKGTTVAYTRGSNSDNNPDHANSASSAKRYREAQKAHEIYYEGLGDTGKTAMNAYPEQSRRNKPTVSGSNNITTWDNAINAGKNYANQAGQAISSAGQNAINAGKNYANQAGQAISSAVQNASNLVQNAATATMSEIKSTGSQVINSGKNFLKKLFG